MGTPFMSEIRIMAFNFAPKGWAECNGQFLPINQNQALFSLLGTTYGGNGQTTFALPDMRGRLPVHVGASFTQGQAGGQEFHTVTLSEMPAHQHFASASTVQADATTNGPLPTRMLAQSNFSFGYGDATNFGAMSPGVMTNQGGSQPHENRQPFLVLNFCIALQGAFPSQN
jgi:microcystin-dependent protein